MCSVFVFPSLFSSLISGKTLLFVCGHKKAQFPCFFGRSSLTSSHSETRIPIAFFCMPDLRALPLRSTCICPVRLHMVSYLNIFFIKCLQVQSFIIFKDQKADDNCTCTSVYFLHDIFMRILQYTKTSARTHTDRCTISRYVFPPLALPKSGAVEDLSSSQPVTQAPVSLFLYMIALMYRVVKQK